MRTIGACLALISTATWAHGGHDLAQPHLHAAEWWALLVLSVIAAWLLARGGRR